MRNRGDRPCPLPGVLPQNWSGNEPNRTVSPVWYSELRLTTGVTYLFAMMNFVDLELVFADQEASVTTTT
ncbi:hypothetical protein TNCV_4598921, partial [Trichonephila clavipes]